MNNKKRIAILFYEKEKREKINRYLIVYLANFWREDGHEVIFLFGTQEFIPADIIILHVDLSEVPQDYIDFSSRYPIAINNKVKNIKKSFISKNIISPESRYGKKVIVKSDLNYAGLPEYIFNQGNDFSYLKLVQKPSDYKIYDSIKSVPTEIANTPGLIIEKFLPEREGNLYVIRHYHFLGKRETFTKMLSTKPVINSNNCIKIESVEPDPAIRAFREEMNFDYGKFDYVINKGKVILFDANKTVGFIPVTNNSKLESMRRHRAEGLYDYF